MNKKTKEIIKDLKANKDVIVVGPSDSDRTHLRIYSHGGYIGGIPLTDQSWWKLPDEKYLDVDFDKKNSLNIYLSAEKNCKNNPEKKLYRQKLYSDPMFISAITNATQKRFSSKNATIKDEQERSIQTKIVKKYLSEEREGGFIVCDMEHCVPKKEYLDGCSTYLTQYENYFSEPIDYKEKAPKFDIIAINPESKKIGFIELKCNESACSNESGLKTHLKDTFACMNIPNVRKRIAFRFQSLQACGFLPAELEDIDSAFFDYEAFCGFLFVKGKNLQTKASAIKICETELKEILREENDINDRLLFSFAEDACSVDLNNMQTWDEFCK